ncbi:MAG: hypothetical protein K8U57_15965 [Planctomycetes bacterium]|nr:hypothetical protein [Planctomycetota bacterium]
MSQRQILVAMLCIVVLCILCILVGCGSQALLRIPLLVAFGWPWYVSRSIRQLDPDPWAVISGVVCLAAVTVGMHLFSRWIYAATDATPEGTARRRWPWKWTGQLVGLLVLMFLAGVAFTGLVQQSIWVIRSPNPLPGSNWQGKSPSIGSSL